MNAIVVGASAGLGRALSEALAARGHDLVLVAQDARDVDAQAAWLRLKYSIRVVSVAADAADLERLLAALRDATSGMTQIHGLYFPAGFTFENDRGTLGVPETRRLLDVNLTSVIVAVADLMPRMLACGPANIVGFGSIASIRGRNANVVYAAAKRALASYFESLRHRCAGSDVRVQFYQLGYLDTQQTFGRKLLFPPASPERVARYVMNNLNHDKGNIFLPRYWTVIAAILRLLPWSIYKKLQF